MFTVFLTRVREEFFPLKGIISCQHAIKSEGSFP